MQINQNMSELNLREYADYARNCGIDSAGLNNNEFSYWIKEKIPFLKGLMEAQRLDKSSVNDRELMNEASNILEGFQSFFFDMYLSNVEVASVLSDYLTFKKTLEEYGAFGSVTFFAGNDKEIGRASCRERV